MYYIDSSNKYCMNGNECPEEYEYLIPDDIR